MSSLLYDHPEVMWLMGMVVVLLFLLVVGITVHAVVERAIALRLSEIRQLFRDALNIDKGYSAEVAHLSQAQDEMRTQVEELTRRTNNLQLDLDMVNVWRHGVDDLAVIRASRGMK